MYSDANSLQGDSLLRFEQKIIFQGESISNIHTERVKEIKFIDSVAIIYSKLFIKK